MTLKEIESLAVYFRPELLAPSIVHIPSAGITLEMVLGPVGAEALKWCNVLVIPVWLSIVQFSARRRTTPDH